ncbi:reverse transcriptase domain-containing protein [Tanacetum coccineum]
MSTRSSSTDIFPPSSDPESIIRNRRRNLGDPSFLLDFEEINLNPNNVQGPPLAGAIPQNHGAARAWLEKEPPNSITTWNDLVSKFVNQFFPPSRTTNLRNVITNFQQKFGQTFNKAWDRFKDLLNKCPHHGFSPLHQIDTFYNGLNQSDQDSLNSAAVSSASSSLSQNDDVVALTKQVEALVSSMNKSINSIQEGCETCGGPHSYFECQAAGGYTQDVYDTTGNYNAGGNSYQFAGSGLTTAEPSIPLHVLPTPREEVEKEPETLMYEVHIKSQASTVHVPPLGIQPVSPPKPKEDPKPNLH